MLHQNIEKKAGKVFRPEGRSSVQSLSDKGTRIAKQKKHQHKLGLSYLIDIELGEADEVLEVFDFPLGRVVDTGSSQHKVVSLPALLVGLQPQLALNLRNHRARRREKLLPGKEHLREQREQFEPLEQREQLEPREQHEPREQPEPRELRTGPTQT